MSDHQIIIVAKITLLKITPITLDINSHTTDTHTIFHDYKNQCNAISHQLISPFRLVHSYLYGIFSPHGLPYPDTTCT